MPADERDCRLRPERVQGARRSRKTEVEVAAAVEHAIAVRGHGYKGARWVRGFCTVSSGPELAEGWKYWRARTRAIEEDDVVMLELGPSPTDTGATIRARSSPARPPRKLAAAYAAVRAAAAAGFAAARPGADRGRGRSCLTRGAAPRPGSRSSPITPAHGTGFRYHESRPSSFRAARTSSPRATSSSPSPASTPRSSTAASATRTTRSSQRDGAAVLATTDYGLDL